MALDLTEIPADLGVAGAHLAKGGMAGSPDLRELLVEYKTALETLDTGAPQIRTMTVAFNNAAFVAAVANGAAAQVNIGDVLPANARVLGVDMSALTPFSGGGLTALACDVGTSGDADALVDGADLFAAAVDGGPSTMPSGIRPNKKFTAAGAQLIATFTPDGAHALANVTAGSVTIDVAFVVLP